jgi:hypothetical protein
MAESSLGGCGKLAASLVDGALGISWAHVVEHPAEAGISPAGVSTTVNLAKVGRGAARSRIGASATSITACVEVAIPVLGALIGHVLANVDGTSLSRCSRRCDARGLRILWRFRSEPIGSPAKPNFAHDPDKMPPFDQRVEIAATTGGITNGLIGAWGPIVTPFLLMRLAALRDGSVNTAEVAVAVVSVGADPPLGGEHRDRRAARDSCSAAFSPRRSPRMVRKVKPRSASQSVRSCC